ncbi:MAG: inositol monophosphatase [Anaerolineaceae bacterium]|nr:inositol monophosphatase [Anaerolineaceae bacterium]
MQPSLKQIETWARQAGEILRDRYGKQHTIRHKGVIDLVTEADHLVEAYLLEQIHNSFPDHRIYTEESGVHSGDDDSTWYIDPLDGTVNFAHGIPIFTVSIGFASQGKLQLGVVYDPMRDELFSAQAGKGAWLNSTIQLQVTSPASMDESLLTTGFPYEIREQHDQTFKIHEHFARHSQGVRRLGSAALDLCYVAAGRFDGYWELKVMPYDVAAGALIAMEAGALVTTTQGDPLPLNPPISILAASRNIHSSLVRDIQSFS